MRLFFLFVGVVFHFSAYAACPSHSFADPKQIQFSGDSVLIVTHPSTDFDGRMSTKVGMDAAVRFAKQNRIPVVYLQDDGPNEHYFFEDCHPDFWVSSQGGELSFQNIPRHLYSVGGHWELCQSFTMNDVLLSWSKQPKEDAKITVFMDAVYMKATMSFQDSDPYYSDFQRFLGIVNYDRVMSEAFSNKITMLEAMGVIIKQDRQLDFLIRSLPQYQRTLPDYKVVITLGGSFSRVLQKGKGSNPPVLTFDFVNTALGKY